MPEDTQHKDSLMNKIIHPHRHKHEEQAANDKPESAEGGPPSEMKKDEEIMKHYLKKDEQMEQEGKTYGGLM
ncbi:uncharacterized protein BDV14DRAFT_177345 [Aspergillus stella-maris]|uniref:uncharacterized protein n=1 Tax=Aspergillus stella-maris TaxID=1810926 RepID=UPI003CCE2D36